MYTYQSTLVAIRQGSQGWGGGGTLGVRARACKVMGVRDHAQGPALCRVRGLVHPAPYGTLAKVRVSTLPQGCGYWITRVYDPAKVNLAPCASLYVRIKYLWRLRT